MTTVAFRIPDEMKKKMDKTDINWSDYVRHAIGEALHSQTKRELIRKIHGLSAGRKGVKQGTAVKILRHLRDHA